MGGGKILEMIKRVYKDDPDAISAINETLSKNKKATDDSNVDKEKIKKLQSNSTPKKTARDDSAIAEEDKQKRKAEIRAELEKWASNKKNEPREGWGLTDKRYKEIRLRKKYIEDGGTCDWVEYLRNNGLKVIIKSTLKQTTAKISKDDSQPDILKVQSENLSKKMNNDILPAIEKSKLQKMAKDTSDLLSVAKRFENIDVTKIKTTEFNTHANDLKAFFDKARFLLEDEKEANSMVKCIKKMSKFMDMFKNVNSITQDTKNEAEKVLSQMRNEIKKIKG